ncbi:MAG: RHS repeat-associated core domain-containing protein, partial [Kiritimatiellae bacterium]|nr:RHS repeat-associated core domain-containing protein [Kiritimatiellia bacterium]
RTLRNMTGYHADGTVSFTAEADGTTTNVTSYSARQYLESPGGAYIVIMTDPLSNATTNFYSADGSPYRSEGATYPTETTQNVDGYRSELRTWRDESGQPDTTRWHYDLASGLVTNKLYADGLGPSYAYTPDGRLSQRTWARGVETDYGYDDTEDGATKYATYSDATPGVTNTYDLAGRLVSVEDGTGTRSFAYDARGRVTAETNALAAISREYNALGLPSGFAADNDVTVGYAYDSLMRMTNVCFGALSFDYGYLPHTRLPESVVNSCGIGWQRVYEKNRNLIASVTNFSGETAVASFGYVNDALGRRIARNNDAFAYNARSELTNAVMNAGGYGYGYDGIGNLLFSAAGTVTNTYTANSLNQYAAIAGGMTVSPTFDADGNMSWDGRFIFTWDAENRLIKSQPGGTVTNGAKTVDSGYDYLNRRHSKTVRQLSGRGSGYPLDSSQAGTWDIVGTNTFLYDGWNLYREIESVGGAAVTNIYVWGLDISGSLRGAGGVGGLLAVLRNGTPYFPCYDANGNVTDYVNESGTVVAHREYDPFGRTTVATGPLVHDLHFWFSTKYLDEETGLYYYGERFYSPELMRWLNRDPIEERGGVPLYCFVNNNPINATDPIGLCLVFHHLPGVEPPGGMPDNWDAATHVQRRNFSVKTERCGSHCTTYHASATPKHCVINIYYRTFNQKNFFAELEHVACENAYNQALGGFLSSVNKIVCERNEKARTLFLNAEKILVNASIELGDCHELLDGPGGKHGH